MRRWRRCGARSLLRRDCHRAGVRVGKRLLIAVLLLILLAGSAMMFAGWLLSRPVPVRIGTAPADLQAEEIRFRSDSGAEVHGWWCPIEGSRGSILLLPGIRANRLSMVERARFLRRVGYSTLLVDLQATGETPGDRITFGWRESRDVVAAVGFLRKATPETKIAVVGSSLGGAAALFAAPELQLDGMVLEAVYPTMRRATENRLRKYLGSAGTTLSYPLLLADAEAAPPDSGAAAAHRVSRGTWLPCPHHQWRRRSQHDPEDAVALYHRAPPPKELWLVEGAGHVDLHRAAGAAYEERLLGFLSRMERGR